MRNRINLLALLVIATGGAVIARPSRAHATYLNPVPEMFGSCCSAYANGNRIAYCCAMSGCYITKGYCMPLA